MSANVRYKWVRRDRGDLILALSVAPVGLIALGALIYALTLTAGGIL